MCGRVHSPGGKTTKVPLWLGSGNYGGAIRQPPAEASGLSGADSISLTNSVRVAEPHRWLGIGRESCLQCIREELLAGRASLPGLGAAARQHGMGKNKVRC